MPLMKPKIVLYNPKAVFYTMPLGLMAVASALDRDVYDVRIIDGRLVSDPVKAVLNEIDGAMCLGVTVLTGAPLDDALKVLRAAKSAKPELPTVCGGWHPSLFPTEMLKEDSIDVTVQGQGEATFAEVIDRMARNAPLDDVQGISWQKDNKAIQNAPRALIPMDVLPPVDYELIDVEQYFKLKGQRQLDFISSTGCLFRCAFCADPFVYGRKWTAIAPDRLTDEIESLWRKYQFDDLNFQDETFFTYRKRVAEIAEQLIRRQLPISWAATMRADQGVRLGEELFRLCVRSGMRRVLIGVESGSPSMLRRIKKDTTVEQIVESAQMCAKHGVAVIFSFIVGLPGERFDDVLKTVELVKTLRGMSPNFETPIFYYKPYPGSELSQSVDRFIPQTLDDWANFDFVQGEAGQWVDADTYQFMERFKFYNRHAWGHSRFVKRPLQWMARWRCKKDWYDMPIEKSLVQRFWPEAELS